ncbi:MAG: molybdopterin-dependent oxidoreductase [Mariniblastus sp.]
MRESEKELESALIPPGQQLVAPGKWPVIGEREPADALPNSQWKLRIFGECNMPIELTLKELRELPRTTQTIDIHCVTRWSKLGVEFTGVLLEEILKRVSPTDSAKFVSFVARSKRKHSTSLGLQTSRDLQTLIALEVDGQPIDRGHGGPLRNVAVGRYFYKSVKWLEAIELLSQDRLGFWEAESGYHNNADPWKEQRYMAPTIDRRESIRLIETKNFSNRDLRSIDCSDRDLGKLNAAGASLRDANFSRADLHESDFSAANLSNAHFRNANLHRSNFEGADLEGADLSGADLRGANLSNCSLIGASFFSSENDQNIEAIFDAETVLPETAIAPLFPEQLAFVKKSLSALQQ